MKIWIISPYGNVPGEGWKLHRSYMIAEAFSAKGHNVNYWVSNIDHRSKKIRSKEFSRVQVKENLCINIVPSCKYSEHMSLDRIRSEVRFIKNLKKKALSGEEKPDFIILAEPAVFISLTFVSMVRKLNVGFAVDFIDLWPELFTIALPGFLSGLSNIVFAPLYWKRRWLVKKADVIYSVSNAYLEVAKRYNKKAPSKVTYWGVDLNDFNKTDSAGILGKLNLPEKNMGELWIIYAGTLGDNYDVRTIISFAKKLDNSDLNMKLLIAGDGNLKEFVSESVSDLSSGKTVFLGRISGEELGLLYKFCDISLSTYVPGSTVSMPIKAFDYFAAGLPLINSLGMDLRDFVEKRNVGLQYKAGDPDDMLDKISILYYDRSLLSLMKGNCLKLAREFDQNELYSDFAGFLENVISKS